MSHKRFDAVMAVVMGAIYLFAFGFIAVFLIFVMVRYSMYYFVFLFIAAMLSAMALYGVWILWTAVPALMSVGKEEGEAAKGPKRRRAQSARPGKRPKRSAGPKPGLAGGSA